MIVLKAAGYATAPPSAIIPGTRSKAIKPGRAATVPLSTLLGVRLELRLQRSKLCERRVRIGRLVALVAIIAALDVFRAQRRIAIRTIAAVAPVAAIGPIASAAIRTIAVRKTLRACVPAGAASLLAAITMHLLRTSTTLRSLAVFRSLVAPFLIAPMMAATMVPAIVGNGHALWCYGGERRTLFRGSWRRFAGGWPRLLSRGAPSARGILLVARMVRTTRPLGSANAPDLNQLRFCGCQRNSRGGLQCLLRCSLGPRLLSCHVLSRDCLGDGRRNFRRRLNGAVFRVGERAGINHISHRNFGPGLACGCLGLHCRPGVLTVAKDFRRLHRRGFGAG